VNYVQIYFSVFYQFTWKRKSKISLTLGYYFSIKRSEQFFITNRETAKSNDYANYAGNLNLRYQQKAPFSSPPTDNI